MDIKEIALYIQDEVRDAFDTYLMDEIVFELAEEATHLMSRNHMSIREALQDVMIEYRNGAYYWFK